MLIYFVVFDCNNKHINTYFPEEDSQMYWEEYQAIHAKQTNNSWWRKCIEHVKVRLKLNNISESYVEKLWLEIGEAGNIPKDLCGLNFNNSTSIRKVVDEHLLSMLQFMSVSNHVRIKNSLKYAINFWDEEQLKKAYNTGSPMIGLPTVFTCREFYVQVWACLFPNESYIIKDRSKYVDIGPFESV